MDVALGAVLLRCVLALAAAAALFGSKTELRRTAATLHPEWSAATLAEKVDSELRSNAVLTLGYIALVLLVAKYLRDGRNWARWLYTFVAFLVAGDVFRLTGLFSGDYLLFRLLSGLTGLASLAAIVLLFLPTSADYFRSAGSSRSPLGALFGGRAAMAARDAASRPAAEPVSLTKPARGRAAVASPDTASSDTASYDAASTDAASTDASRAGAKRVAPKAKSRKQASP